MSKQLSISAAVSVFVMVLFVLAATPNAMRDGGVEAPGGLAAPAFQISVR